MGRKPLPPKTKIVDGQVKEIYAKGLTKSEYVLSRRDPKEFREYMRRWRERNRKHYNAYHRDYYKEQKLKLPGSGSIKADTSIDRSTRARVTR